MGLSASLAEPSRVAASSAGLNTSTVISSVGEATHVCGRRVQRCPDSQQPCLWRGSSRPRDKGSLACMQLPMRTPVTPTAQTCTARPLKTGHRCGLWLAVWRVMREGGGVPWLACR
eukprot:365837-Chlamydomonas_euryale.AAC.12